MTQEKKYWGPDIAQLCVDEIESLDVNEIAEHMIGLKEGFNDFLINLDQQLQEPTWKGCHAIINGIRTGFYGNTCVEFKLHDKRRGQIIFTLARLLALRAQRHCRNAFVNNAFQDVIHELHNCYFFGIGVSKNTEIAKKLEPWLIDPDEERDEC